MSSRPVSRVLVVEDDVATLRFLRVLFSGDPHVEIVECTDGEEARVVLIQQDFDLVVLDLWMPRLDGHGVIEMFRSRPAPARPRVIVISAERYTTLRELPHDIVQVAVEKPFDIEELREVVRCCLSLENTRAKDDRTPVVESSYWSGEADRDGRAKRFRSVLQEIRAVPNEAREPSKSEDQQPKRGAKRSESGA